MPSGRKKATIDWNNVSGMLEAGCTGTEVAAFYGIHPETLYKRVQAEFNMDFSDYLHQKRAKGDMRLRAAQYKKAMAGDNSMMIWLGKNRLNQSDKAENTNIHKFPDNITIEVIKPDANKTT